MKSGFGNFECFHFVMIVKKERECERSKNEYFAKEDIGVDSCARERMASMSEVDRTESRLIVQRPTFALKVLGSPILLLSSSSSPS
jgi:hypothetical protein